MAATINKQLFFFLLPVYIAMVVAGTLHHETGHYLAARWMGLQATIHYNFTHAATPTGTGQLTIQQQFWFILCGPLQTMLTGTLALIILCSLDKPNQLNNFTRYTLIFIALLWIRQPANLFIGLLKSAVSGRYPVKGDEAKLSLYFHLPVWSLNVATAIVGISVIWITIFRFIPARQRFTFWLAGSIGGATGFYLWMIWLGKYILT